MTIAKSILALALGLLPVSAFAGERLLSEVRIGAMTGVDNDWQNIEKGAFVSGMMLFDPFDYRSATGFDRFTHPLLHVGGDISTAGEADQLYAGVTWRTDFNDRVYLELGFGGTVHDGELQVDNTPGPELGCRVLFHEYVGLGFNISQNWTLNAILEHSSHGGLCGYPNNGLSRGGVMVGYKF